MYLSQRSSLWSLASVFILTTTFIFVGLALVILAGIAGVLGRAALLPTALPTPQTRLIVIPGPSPVAGQGQFRALTELVQQPVPAVVAVAPPPAAHAAPDSGPVPVAPVPVASAPVVPGPVASAGEDAQVAAVVARFSQARQAAPPPPQSPPDEIPVASYRELFGIVGAEFGLDWRLLAAMAWRESRLDPLAVGQAQEWGLMQILPSTWAEFAPALEEAAPFTPYGNVRVGAAYVVYLTELLEPVGWNQVHWVLLAYNWGPNNVLRLQRQGGGWADVPAVRRGYVNDILQAAYGFAAPGTD